MRRSGDGNYSTDVPAWRRFLRGGGLKADAKRYSDGSRGMARRRGLNEHNLSA
jgi:hypothetical protein